MCFDLSFVYYSPDTNVYYMSVSRILPNIVLFYDAVITRITFDSCTLCNGVSLVYGCTKQYQMIICINVIADVFTRSKTSLIRLANYFLYSAMYANLIT